MSRIKLIGAVTILVCLVPGGLFNAVLAEITLDIWTPGGPRDENGFPDQEAREAYRLACRTGVERAIAHLDLSDVEEDITWQIVIGWSSELEENQYLYSSYSMQRSEHFINHVREGVNVLESTIYSSMFADYATGEDRGEGPVMEILVNGLLGNWDFSLDSVEEGSRSLVYGIMHEMLHALCVDAHLNVVDNHGFFGQDAGYTFWAKHIADPEGNLLWQEYENGSEELAELFLSPDGEGLFYVEETAVQANGGNSIPLYTWEHAFSPSAGMHLSDAYNGTADQVLTRVSSDPLPEAEWLQRYGTVVLGILEGMGWRIRQPDPELMDVPDSEIDEDNLFVVNLEIIHPREEAEYSFTAESNHDSVTLSIEGNTLDVLPAENWYGEVEIEVIASEEDGEWADTISFTLIVHPVNDPVIPPESPVVLPTGTEGEGYQVLCNLDTLFISVDGGVEYELSEETLLHFGLSAGHLLTQNPFQYFNGEVAVDVMATDGNFDAVSATFIKEVTPVPSPVAWRDLETGEVRNELSLQLCEGDTLALVFYAWAPDRWFEGIDLDVAFDPDGLVGPWEFTSLSDSTWLFAWTVPFDAGDQSFDPSVTAIAPDNEIVLSLHLAVDEVNRPPEVVESLQDATIEEDSDTLWVNLRGVAVDPDEDVLNPQLGRLDHFEGAVRGDTLLWLLVHPDWFGQENVVVTFMDGRNGSVVDGFTVTVTPVNDAPQSFSLRWPENNMPVSREVTTLLWESAMDVDHAPEELVYTATLLIEDSTLTVQSAGTEQAVDFQMLLSDLGYVSGDEETLEVTWWVSVTDGEYQVDSNERWVLVVPLPLLGVNEEHDLPVKFALGLPYPNPFNASVAVDYALPRDTWLRLTAYNVVGQQVAVLLKGKQPAGRHHLVWNADTVPAGVYLLVLETAEKQFTRRVVLLR